MAKPKKYLRKTINFGESRNPARILAEEYIKDNGNQSLSKLVRRLVYCELSNDSNHKGYKIKALKCDQKKLSEEIIKLNKQMQEISNNLIEWGVEDPLEDL